MSLTNLASFQLVLWNILERYDQDPDDVFRKVGLNPTFMHQPGKRYPIRKTDQLWEEASSRISDPCFGLSAVDAYHPSDFGVLGYAMLASHSLRTSLVRLKRFYRVVTDTPFMELKEDTSKGTLSINMADYDIKQFLTPALEDATVALILALLRLNYRRELNPVEVAFRHSCPECSSTFSDYFKSPIIFDSPRTKMLLPLDVVDEVLPSGNEELAEVNEQLMANYLATLDENNLVAKIKRIIVDHLPDGNATLETAADQLYSSTRTLQRQLSQEGTGFIKLLNETRKELAEQYVQDKTRDLSEIAFLLGFAELSTFSRSFKRWTGKSPIQYRKVA